MTKKEIKKLKRPELYELMYYMREEIDSLTNENARIRERIRLLLDNEEKIEPDVNLVGAVIPAVKKSSCSKKVCHKKTCHKKAEYFKGLKGIRKISIFSCCLIICISFIFLIKRHKQ